MLRKNKHLEVQQDEFFQVYAVFATSLQGQKEVGQAAIAAFIHVLLSQLRLETMITLLDDTLSYFI